MSELADLQRKEEEELAVIRETDCKVLEESEGDEKEDEEEESFFIRFAGWKKSIRFLEADIFLQSSPRQTIANHHC